ncbi:MAG: efflux RND transporter permease subunit, partial [Steroidobacteraceae bacterium]|nr:efflux RND transporter permease subunit [Steroidobacteraceae bacterium]
MARFFIDRPVFAWVLAIIVMLSGVISITRLAVERYPTIAPPTISISAFYPGATAQAVEESVTQIIEQSMKGLDGLIYMSSTSGSDGGANISLTFDSGTNADVAQVQVQNKLQLATPLLPAVVRQQGVSVTKSNTGFLMVVAFTSRDGRLKADDVADYVTANIVDPLARVPGVGNVQAFGTKYAMRIWLDPSRLETYRMNPSDVIAAIRAQNQQVAIGELGGTPSIPGQQLNASITAQ